MLVVYMVQLVCSMFPCTPTIDSHPISSTTTTKIYPPIIISPSGISSSPFKSFPTTTAYTFPPPPIDDDKNKMSIVSTHDGQLKGFTMKSISGISFLGFQGIPFAEPPIGNLRFRPPVKKSPWVGIRDAIVESPTCLQTDYFQDPPYKIVGTEDCLHLSVYTHKISSGNEKSNNLSAVMVFIHGGGFFFGSSNLYGPAYILEEDIVLVTINYRLGALGFLTTGKSGDDEAPGNNGLKDQSLALEWVKTNIHFFGGDPNRVTLFGESAGASSVQFHMVSPLSRGLFHGGISESGCNFCFWSISEKAIDIGKKYGSSLNCPIDNSSQMLNCLRKLDGNSIASAQLGLLEWTMYPVIIFGPVIEPKHKGAFLDDLPANIYERGEAAQVPWISGFNSDEGALNIIGILINNKTHYEINNEWNRVGPVFLEINNNSGNSIQISNRIREYYLGEKDIKFETRHEAVKMFSDRYVNICGIKAIMHHAKFNEYPVYTYYLNYRGAYSYVQLLHQKPSDWGVSHLDDLIYLMNNTVHYSRLKVTDEEYKVSRIIIKLWTNFAKTGEPFHSTPDGKLTRIWKPIDIKTKKMEYLEINLNPKMIPDPYNERVHFWDNLELEEDK